MNDILQEQVPAMVSKILRTVYAGGRRLESGCDFRRHYPLHIYTCYWAPDTLEWSSLGVGHSAFVEWALT